MTTVVSGNKNDGFGNKKEITMNKNKKENALFSFYKFKDITSSKDRTNRYQNNSDESCGRKIPGYFVLSTAPTNLEDSNKEITKIPALGILERIQQDGLEKIANDIQTKNAGNSEALELVIAIHGYNTTGDGVQKWYKEILDFANQRVDNKTFSNNCVFLGYRWPSESFTHNVRYHIHNAFCAMPLVLKFVLGTGCFAILLGIILSFLDIPLIALSMVLLGSILFSIPLTLIIIRLFVYHRDSYRAINFAIPDLVELIRLIDDKLLTNAVEEFKTNKNSNQTYKILETALSELETGLQKQLTLEIKRNNKNIHNLSIEILKDYLKSENYWTGGKICIPKVVQKSLRELGVDEEKIKNLKVQQEVIQILDKNLDEQFHELIQKGFKKVAEKDEFSWINNDDKRIRLTFLCHSMGAFVTTGAVRILADVFDPNSVGTLDLGISKKLPTSNIGHVFRLGRLILASPDIPQSAITSNRNNRLRASLRRFEEAYLFSNEGDMALLVASTSANYFSLPTRTGEMSFRLGNLTVKRNHGYGIVNLKKLHEPNLDLLTYLEIGEKCLKTIRANTKGTICDKRDSNSEEEELIANLFTYFDCTDYTDLKYETKLGKEEPTKKPIRVLSYPLTRKNPLCRFVTQVRLVIDNFICQSIDGHGGYFDGKFSRELIYRLAFGGFKDLVNSPEKLDKLNEILEEKKIRVVLSPERYLVDIERLDYNQVREKVIYQHDS